MQTIHFSFYNEKVSLKNNQVQNKKNLKQLIKEIKERIIFL